MIKGPCGALLSLNMRTLVRFAVCFCITVFAGVFSFYYTDLHLAISLIAAACGICLPVVFSMKNSLPCICGFAAGFIYYTLLCILIIFPRTGLSGNEVHDAVFVCTDHSSGYAEYGSVEAKLTYVDGKRIIPMEMTLYLEDGSPSLVPGNTLLTKAVFKTTKYRGAFSSNGRILTASQEGPLFIGKDDKGITPALAIFRYRVSNRLTEIFGNENGALISAVFSGERSGLTDEAYRDLKLSGAAHTVCVSGMHMSVLASFIITVFGRRKGVFAALPLLFLYSAFTGFSAPTLRALIMTSLSLLTVFVVRNYDPLTGLMAALLAIVSFDPFSMLTPSLLLSFGASLGMVLFLPSLTKSIKLPSYKRPVLRKAAAYLRDCTLASVTAQVITIPIAMLFFGRISLGAVITSLLIMPAVHICLIGAMILLPASLIYLPAAAAVGSILPGIAAKYIYAVCGFIADIPWFSAGAGSFTMILFASALAAFAFLTVKKKHLGAIAVFLAASACASLFATCIENNLAMVKTVSKNGSTALIVTDGKESFIIDPVSAMQRNRICSELERIGIFSDSRVLFTTPKVSEYLLTTTAEDLLSADITVTDDRIPGTQVYLSGSFACGRWMIRPFPAGDEYAVIIEGEGMSILYLMGMLPIEAAFCCAENGLTADVIITDGKIYSSVIMEKIEEITCAKTIYISDSKYSRPTPGENAALLSKEEMYYITLK